MGPRERSARFGPSQELIQQGRRARSTIGRARLENASAQGTFRIEAGYQFMSREVKVSFSRDLDDRFTTSPATDHSAPHVLPAMRTGGCLRSIGYSIHISAPPARQLLPAGVHPRRAP